MFKQNKSCRRKAKHGREAAFDEHCSHVGRRRFDVQVLCEICHYFTLLQSTPS